MHRGYCEIYCSEICWDQAERPVRSPPALSSVKAVQAVDRYVDSHRGDPLSLTQPRPPPGVSRGSSQPSQTFPSNIATTAPPVRAPPPHRVGTLNPAPPVKAAPKGNATYNRADSGWTPNLGSPSYRTPSPLATHPDLRYSWSAPRHVPHPLQTYSHHWGTGYQPYYGFDRHAATRTAWADTVDDDDWNTDFYTNPHNHLG